MKIVFFGTPKYVLPLLDVIHETFKQKVDSPIVAVVTQMPRPAGRKQKLEYSPVDKWAHQKNIPVFFSGEELINKKIEADLGILASFGEIIPKKVIEYFPNGILNIHPSLLPKWRGASPVQAAIISEAKETGVTIMKLDEKLDHGPIVSQFKEKIKSDDTSGALRQKLFKKSTQFLVDLIPGYLEGNIRLKEQDHKLATFASLIKKEHAFIPPKYLNSCLQGVPLREKWNILFAKSLKIKVSPTSIEKFIRGMDPWPIAWTTLRLNSKSKAQKRLKILKAHLEGGKLVLDKVQLEGKTPVSWKQFRQGHKTPIFK